MAVSFLRLGKFGRLGNQLFQIASTIGIAKKNDMEYKFPSWDYAKYFKNELPGFVNSRPTFNVFSEKNFHYDDYTLIKSGDYDLQGYFQSEKYWNHCKCEVMNYFEFTEDLKRIVTQKNPNALPFNQVAIHVRRGDYLNLAEYHTNLPLDYYKKAISFFPDKRFIVFSDDIEWCRKNFLGDRFYFSTGTEIEDLYLMSMCEGHIIANSSFSWWGSYLAGSKYTIAPRDWFGHKITHSTKDLYLKHWTLI